jgi:hypothetical protein
MKKNDDWNIKEPKGHKKNDQKEKIMTTCPPLPKAPTIPYARWCWNVHNVYLVS